jgi:serralysin
MSHRRDWLFQKALSYESDTRPDATDALDVVSEATGDGTDSVRSTVSYTLSAHVENLRLMGGNLNATGNAQANRLYGTSGNNILYGKEGADEMFGGLGGDT